MQLLVMKNKCQESNTSLHTVWLYHYIQFEYFLWPQISCLWERKLSRKIYHDEQWFDECVFPIKITDIDVVNKCTPEVLD